MATRKPSRAPATSTAGGAHIPPDGELRRSQLVTTWGPGALVDLLHDAVIVSSLDYWRDVKGWHIIAEPRLRHRLASLLKKSGRPLSVDRAFRLPPAAPDERPIPGHGIAAREFPEWFVCQNPGCRALIGSASLERKGDRYVHRCTQKGVECVPVRFVTACSRGHIDEFPWVAFVHGGPTCEAPALRLSEGATGDFASIFVRCDACGASRSMLDAKRQENYVACRGRRPWLGPEGDEPCELHRRLLVRTASNAYFSQVESALSIPDHGDDLYDRVHKHWAILQSATAATLPVFRTIPHVQADLASASDPDVLAVIAMIVRGDKPERAPLRTAEFEVFTRAPLDKAGDLPRAGELFFARRAALTPPPGVASVVLARKLREVRAQIGFTRLEAAMPSLQGEFDIGVRTAPLALTADWLPAVEIHGEGIFVALEEGSVQAWEARPAVQARAEVLAEAWAHHVASRRLNLDDEEELPPWPGIRFYLVHSLSHLLLTALSLECGYAASAIRERLYVAPADAATPMAAFLLSTGTPGTEGTLGGLVAQGQHLNAHLTRALSLASLCSYDPVCAMHDPASDHADRNLDGAACHGCLYVAECSCERFNQYLDRALVVPILGQDPDLAFFRGLT